GSTTIGTPSDRITSPVNVFSVGALQSNMTSRADFSSMGPSGVDHYTKKPEVMAHGDNVRSSTMDGSYGYMSGTSMATPHVAGAIALLKCAYPDATPFEVKAALLFSATDLGPTGEDNEFGTGKINLLSAYNFLNKSLVADSMERSTISGQREVLFSLRAGAANAGRTYVLMGSISGSTPGTTLPGPAGLLLPLNMDFLTDLTLIYTNSILFQNFSGTLDAGGNATALLWMGRLLDDPSFIGTVLTFAYCAWPPPYFDFVSNAWDIELIP
ncbi:MAG: S8 family serine peptidase, partial [Planctomycetota bacterium]